MNSNTSQTTGESNFRIIVDNVSKVPERFQSLPLISADSYLSGEYADKKSLKIINLCTHKRSLSTSYYVSLLAEARGHRVLPEAKTLHQIESKLLVKDATRGIADLVDTSFKRLVAPYFAFSVYFGENLAKTHDKLAKRLYALFPCPLVRYEFQRKDGKWKLKEAVQLGLNQIPSEHEEFVDQKLVSMTQKRWRRDTSAKNYIYDIAILVNPEEATPPSDSEALAKFCKAAHQLEMRAEIIGPRDLPRLMEFDALFLRETTRLDNHTMRFAIAAARSGMVVIDDPESIRRCCNKVYLAELLRSKHIKTPESTLITKRNIDEIAPTFSFPLVVKIPDGSFSIGVHKVTSKEQLLELCRELFRTSSIVIAQEFLPTEFDWRIGIVDGKPLYACRYYMSRGHWQIYNHSAKGDDVTGDSNGVPISEVPEAVLKTAIRSAALIGNGLYGVDLKQRGDDVYVIEVNDNPSIDAGVEDELIGDELYSEIMRTFLRRLDARRDTSKDKTSPASTSQQETHVKA